MLLSKKEEEFTEAELIERCKKGDTIAYCELIRRNADYITGWIRKFCGSNPDAVEEVYQITTIKYWQRINSFKGNCTFKVWANHVARNTFYDNYRRKSREGFTAIENIAEDSESVRPEFSLSDDTEPSNKIEHDDQLEEHKKIINRLTSMLRPEHSEVLYLFHYEGLNYSEISKAVKIPVGTVLSRLFYARKQAQGLVKKLKLEKYAENFSK